MTIKGSVGKGAKNASDDVAHIRNLLIRHRQWVGFDLRVTCTDTVNETFIKAITNFQKNACALLTQDGRVDPGGFTYKRLSMVLINRPQHAVFNDVCWNPGPDLTDADYKKAADTLGCEVAAIKAVVSVETGRKPHDDQGRPTILFERHKFKKFTNGVYDKTHPDLSGSQGGYGAFRIQYGKLKRAAVLNEDAALKSCSWGAFQIMGFNHLLAGHASAADMVAAMIGSQSEQLKAFVSFIESSNTLSTAIVDKKWAKFAKAYNGPDYAKNNYDTRMQNAYNKYAAEAKAAAKEPAN